MITDKERERVDEIISSVLAGATLSANSLDGLGEEALDMLIDFHKTVFA